MGEKNEAVVYEVRGFIEGYDVSDFYDGGIHRMVIEERQEPDYEEMARYFDSLENGENYE